MIALAAEIGPNIRSLAMCAPFAVPFKSKIANRCSGLLRLSFRPFFFPRSKDKYYPWVALPDMIARWGPRLTHLTLEEVGSEVVDPIVQHCKSRRHLTMRDCSIGYTTAINDSIPEVQIEKSRPCLVFFLASKYLWICLSCSSLAQVWMLCDLHDLDAMLLVQTSALAKSVCTCKHVLLSLLE